MENKNVLIGVLVILLIVVTFSSFGNFSGRTGGCTFGTMMYGAGFGTGGFGGMALFGWLIMILVLIALVLGIIWLFQQLQSPVQRRKR